MPVFKPISRKELIRGLRAAGFSGPHSGMKHQYMMKENLKIRIPNPHRGDINRRFLPTYCGRHVSHVKNGSHYKWHI